MSDPTWTGTPGPNEGVYVISIAAQISGVPPATLRLYEDKGLLSPARTAGRTRRYSPHDIARIHRIAELAAAGINLAGIRLILELQDHNGDLRDQLHHHATTHRSDNERGEDRGLDGDPVQH